MTNKKKCWGDFLTTASAMAIATCAVSNASASVISTNGANTTSSTSTASWAGGSSFVTTDSILLASTTSAITIDSAVTVAGVDLNNLTPTASTPITITPSGATLGSIGHGSGAMKLILNDSATLTLTGSQTIGGIVAANTYNRLGATTLGSTTGGAAGTALTISASGAVTFTNTFNSFTGTTANWGTLNISGANHSFSGIIGGTSKLGAINITDGHTITLGTSVTATSINLGNASSAVTLNTGTITSNITSSTGAANGTVNISGNVTLAGSIGTSTATSPISLYFPSTTTSYIMTLSGSQSIYAPITTATNGKGGITLSGATITTTIYNNIGTADHMLSTFNITSASAQTLVFDSSNTSIDVYTPITSLTVNNTGTLTTQGAHAITFYNVIGSSHPLSQINIGASTTFAGVNGDTGTGYSAAHIYLANATTLTADCTSGTVSISGPIDGTSDGYGSLNVHAYGAIHTPVYSANFSAIGSTHPIQAIRVNVKPNFLLGGGNEVVTFNGNVTTVGNIDVSGSDTVVFNGSVNSTSGNLITDGSFAVYGNVSVQSVILNRDATFAGNVTAPGGINIDSNSFTIQTNSNPINTINGNITGTVSGIFNITGDTKLIGNVGLANGNALGGVTFNTDNTLYISGGSSIYAPISTTAGSPGNSASTLSISGGNVYVYDCIGASSDALLTQIYIGDASALTAHGNIYSNSVYFNNPGAQLTVIGGSANTPLVVSSNIYSSSPGLVAIGDGSAASYVNFTGGIGKSIGQPVQLLTITGSGTPGNASSAIISTPDIYANNVSHTNGAVLDIQTQATTIHGNYSINNAALTLGTQTLAIAAGNTATLAGALTINATYSGIAVPVALDFSAASTLDASGVTAITLNIDNNALTPADAALFTIIKTPTIGTTLPTAPPTITITSTNPVAPLWKWVSFGVLEYNQPQPFSAPANTSQTSDTIPGFLPVGATSADRLSAAPVLAAAGVHSSPNGTIPVSTDANGATTLTLPTSLSLTISNQAPDIQRGLLGTIGDTLQQTGATPDQSVIDIISTLGAANHSIPLSLATAMQNPAESGISKETAADLAELIATLGQDKTQGAVDAILHSPGVVFDAASIISDATTAAIASAINSRINTAAQFTMPTLSISPVAPVIGGIALPSNARVISSEEAVEIPGEDLEAAAYGVAAGSAPYDKFGVWGSINLGHANQKNRKGNPAFKYVSQGTSIGVDTMINERTTIGFNVSNSFTKIKYKGHPQGGKTDVFNWIAALYSNYQFNEKWFVRSIALFNNTHVNNKSLRLTPTGQYGVVQAKYDMLSYGGEAMLGFVKKFVNDVIITPTLGIRLLHTNKISYTERGNTNFNTKSSQRAITNYSSLAGISVAKSFIRSGVELTPEAHINAQYGLNSKGPKGSFVSPFTPNVTTTFVGTAPSKLTTVYGVSFTGTTDRLECSVGAEMTISNKYVGYHGTLKLKVKF